MHPALRKSLSDYRNSQQGDRISTRYCLWTAGIMFVNGMLVVVIVNIAGWCA